MEGPSGSLNAILLGARAPRTLTIDELQKVDSQPLTELVAYFSHESDVAEPK